VSDIIKLTPADLFHMTEAQRVEWCVKHDASFLVSMDRCGYYLFAEPMYEGDPDPGECVVESRLLVVDPSAALRIQENQP
jgi:hypothetical protein